MFEGKRKFSEEMIGVDRHHAELRYHPIRSVAHAERRGRHDWKPIHNNKILLHLLTAKSGCGKSCMGFSVDLHLKVRGSVHSRVGFRCKTTEKALRVRRRGFRVGATPVEGRLDSEHAHPIPDTVQPVFYPARPS